MRSADESGLKSVCTSNEESADDQVVGLSLLVSLESGCESGCESASGCPARFNSSPKSRPVPSGGDDAAAPAASDDGERIRLSSAALGMLIGFSCGLCSLLRDRCEILAKPPAAGERSRGTRLKTDSRLSLSTVSPDSIAAARFRSAAAPACLGESVPKYPAAFWLPRRF